MATEYLRRAATALAAGRVLLGVTALAAPALVTRPWSGTGDMPARVLGRALGGRDLALGIGALAAVTGLQPRAPGLHGQPRQPGVAALPGSGAAGAAAWVGLGALADLGDLLITAAAWRKLPSTGRWFVAGSAGGAAVVGAAATWSLVAGATAGDGADAA